MANFASPVALKLKIPLVDSLRRLVPARRRAVGAPRAGAGAAGGHELRARRAAAARRRPRRARGAAPAGPGGQGGAGRDLVPSCLARRVDCNRLAARQLLSDAISLKVVARDTVNINTMNQSFVECMPNCTSLLYQYFAL